MDALASSARILDPNKVDETVRSFARVLHGEGDHIPEQFFYMQGGFDEVLAAYAAIRPQGS